MSKMCIDPRQPNAALAGLVRMNLAGSSMGTRYGAVAFATPDEVPTDLGAQMQAAVDEVDNQMSTYKPNSDLMVLNRAAPGRWHQVPSALFTVLAQGLEIGRASEGAFDMAVGDAVARAGFGAQAETPPENLLVKEPPTARALAHEALELDPEKRAVRKHSELLLDLSGIAKGFGVDRMAEVLDRCGITRYLVSIDGELRAGSGKPDGQPWVIGVEAPLEGERGAARLVQLENMAAATSGDYRHRRQLGPHSYSHTIDPRTGRPLVNGLASVTVLAKTCMAADALASALMVMGAHKGAQRASEWGVPALFMQRDPDGGVREIAAGGDWNGSA